MCSLALVFKLTFSVHLTITYNIHEFFLSLLQAKPQSHYSHSLKHHSRLHSRTHTLTHAHTLAHSHSHSIAHSLSHAHTHTGTLTHSHTQARVQLMSEILMSIKMIKYSGLPFSHLSLLHLYFFYAVILSFRLSSSHSLNLHVQITYLFSSSLDFTAGSAHFSTRFLKKSTLSFLHTHASTLSFSNAITCFLVNPLKKKKKKKKNRCKTCAKAR